MRWKKLPHIKNMPGIEKAKASIFPDVKGIPTGHGT